MSKFKNHELDLFFELCRSRSHHPESGYQQPDLHEVLLELHQLLPDLRLDESRRQELILLYREYEGKLIVEDSRQLSLFSETDESARRGNPPNRNIDAFSEREIQSDEKRDAVPRPPFNAEYVLHLLLREEERESLAGDLAERYTRTHERFGKRRADLWFYKQVAGSVWPLLRRVIVKVGALAWLGELLRRISS